MAGASTYEQEVLLPGPWGRDRKIYATPAGEEERANARKERGRDEKGAKGDSRMRACTLTKRAIELVNVRPDNR